MSEVLNNQDAVKEESVSVKNNCDQPLIGLRKCPFCGSTPVYSAKSDLVRCPNVECGISDWWMTPEEWNRRDEKKD